MEKFIWMLHRRNFFEQNGYLCAYEQTFYSPYLTLERSQWTLFLTSKKDSSLNALIIEVKLVPQKSDETKALDFLFSVRGPKKYETKIKTNKTTTVFKCDDFLPYFQKEHMILELSLTLTKYTAESLIEMQDEFYKLLNTGNHYVNFLIENQKIPAHKCILSTRSPVFAAMFKHHMKENITNEVIIEDIDKDVMLQLLRFIYTSKVSNIEKIARQLLIAAEKYQLPKLKDICGENLTDQLTVDNASELLIFSDKWCVSNLKQNAIKYFVKNGRAITKGKHWEKFLSESSPQLVGELFSSVFIDECSAFDNLKMLKYKIGL